MQNDVIELKTELKAKSYGYISAALGLVAGLAWSDAIKAFLEKYFPVAADAVMMKFIYAIAITIAVVILIKYLDRLINKTQ